MDMLAELRRRLDVSPADYPDEILDHYLDTAGTAIAPWLVAPLPVEYLPNVEEGTVQLAVKLVDAGSRGVAGMDAAGDWTMPAPAATPGLVRSVFGALGPALATGGLSV